MPKQKTGRIEVITGCMFSGKTEELIRRLERVEIAKRRYLAFKPSTDTRYRRGAIVTHYGREVNAYLLEPGKETIDQLKNVTSVGRDLLGRASVIAFDEGNFFKKNLIDLCKELAKMGKRVIISGLDLTFDQKPFGPMPQLMALAEQIDKLKAVCVKCGEPATKSHRIIKSKEKIVVGGIEKYEALCATCYDKSV